jgi:hypothetical protein
MHYPVSAGLYQRNELLGKEFGEFPIEGMLLIIEKFD